MLTMKIEAVSQTKKGIMVNGGWVNADRSVGTFKDLEKGDVITDVEMSDDGKWVKAYKKGGSQSVTVTPSTGSQSNQDRDSKITRGNAANAGFTAFYQTFMSDKKSHEEALSLALEATDALAQYIAEGI